VTDLPATTDVLADGQRRVSHRAGTFLRAGERRFWRDALRRRMLAGADVLAIFVTAGVVALWDSEGVVAVLLFTPGWIVTAKLVGLYDLDHRRLRHLTTDEFARIVVYVLLGSVALTAVLLLVHGESATLQDAGRMRLRLILVAATVAFRALARYAWRAATPPERALLLGEGPLADQVRRKIVLFPDIHVRIADEREACSPEELRQRPGPLDGIDRVIVATPNLDEELLSILVREAREREVKLSVVPPMRGMFGTASVLSHVADVALVEFTTWDASRTTLLAKRALDVGVAAIGLVLLSPVFLLVALAVKLSSPGPVLFVQVRAGAGGSPFRMLKFRTMRVDAPERLAEVVDLEALDGPAFKVENDPRVTSVGRFLRRTSLDELPQLINILRGEMSLVGPRPEQLELVELYRPEERFRLVAKPGLTGPMQVNGRGQLRFDERLALERDYIENLSIPRDLRILALTITPVLRRRGAY
jgi:exopolysaccharide biosynthesis polyprenyl glycosylphosphotransferase